MHTVLLIDDDEDLIEMVSLGLQQFGMKICCHTDCNNVHQKIINCRPDVILMDIFIGDIDGRSVCFEIKHSHHKKIPIILYSAGNITNSSIEESLSDDFVQKPFNFSELVEKIKKLAV